MMNAQCNQFMLGRFEKGKRKDGEGDLGLIDTNRMLKAHMQHISTFYFGPDRTSLPHPRM
jgi:hypothetical protein